MNCVMRYTGDATPVIVKPEGESLVRLQTCPCGSGKYPEAQYDARGIFLCYTCDKCHKEKMRDYRPEVLTDPNYECSEPVEEE
jgi:hypothetical protein